MKRKAQRFFAALVTSRPTTKRHIPEDFNFRPHLRDDARSLVCIYHHHHHHYHLSVMELGHLLTRSGLTYPEVSSKVCHDSFCQLGNSVCIYLWFILKATFNMWVCGRSLDGILGSNPNEGTGVSCECCVLSGRGLCVRLITYPEVVCLSIVVKPRYWGGPGPRGVVIEKWGGGKNWKRHSVERNIFVCFFLTFKNRASSI